jgi:predicted Zn-dependent protease
VAKKQVAADLFAASSADAIYVRTDKEVKQTVQRLLACLQRVENSAAYQRADFIAQKKLLGYCHATNLQAGEWFVARGLYADARKEYEEITEKEPKNPWGWLALGELALTQNQWPAAADALQKVHQLVPRHLPVLHTLAEVAAAMGNRRQATKWLEVAEKLDA